MSYLHQCICLLYMFIYMYILMYWGTSYLIILFYNFWVGDSCNRKQTLNRLVENLVEGGNELYWKN